MKSDLSAKVRFSIFQWAFEQKFSFEKTLYELRKSFVEIYFEDEEQKIVGSLKINLFFCQWIKVYYKNTFVNLLF